MRSLRNITITHISPKKVWGGSNPKPVLCIETGQTFPSILVAAKSLNTYSSNIHVALNNPNRTCSGYHWKRSEETSN